MSQLEDLHNQRLALMDRLVEQLAIEAGLDISEGLPPYDRGVLMQVADEMYDNWFERVQDGEDVRPSSAVEHLLAKIYALDDLIHGTMEGGRLPGDRLH